MATTVVKKKAEGYGYKYTDMSGIHEHLEANNICYAQYTDTCPINGEDYIYTVPIMRGKGPDGGDLVLEPRRGCKIPKATLSGKSNPAQEYGSAITYARRYSLLMAFGLACDDDDAECYTVALVSKDDIKKLKDELKRTGITERAVLSNWKKAKLEDLTKNDYAAAMEQLADKGTKTEG